MLDRPERPPTSTQATWTRERWWSLRMEGLGKLRIGFNQHNTSRFHGQICILLAAPPGVQAHQCLYGVEIMKTIARLLGLKG